MRPVRLNGTGGTSDKKRQAIVFLGKFRALTKTYVRLADENRQQRHETCDYLFVAGSSASKSGGPGVIVRRCASASRMRSATTSGCAAAMSWRSPGSSERLKSSGGLCSWRG